MSDQINSEGITGRPEETVNSDLELWQKVRLGDQEAFAIIFKKYYQQLYRFAGRLTYDTPAAENIVQDLFVILWTQREKLTIKSALKAYLYTAVKNRALTYIKRTPHAIFSEKMAQYEQGVVQSPEDKYLKKELYTTVHQAIARLPEKCRLVYMMKRYDNLRHSEIAETLNISANTVKTQLQRALKSLEKQLTPFLK
jgi:RNA polymerase sigma-70 factor (ECF subfamily)